MDPRADDSAALADVAQRRRHEVPDRGEDDHGVQLLRWTAECGARPLGSERPREGLRLVVAFARSCEHPSALCNGYLAHDVRRGAEAVEPERLALARESQRAVADEAGTEERRCLRVRVAGG